MSTPVQAAKLALNKAQRAFEIARANLAFARMSKAQQRVVIAQDVIDAIKAKEIIAKNRVYVRMKDENGDELPSLEVEDLLANREVNECEACALGSVFVCALKRDQSIDVEDVFVDNEQTAMREKLAGYFNNDQLMLIEAAFETRYFRNEDLDPEEDDYGETDEDTQAAIDFGLRFSSPSTRLVGIMKNIIANKGVFKP
jgi:hypothetical protein